MRAPGISLHSSKVISRSSMNSAMIASSPCPAEELKALEIYRPRGSMQDSATARYSPKRAPFFKLCTISPGAPSRVAQDVHDLENGRLHPGISITAAEEKAGFPPTSLVIQRCWKSS